jgi:putative Mg2+ transporter-C (MgtC) family protein
VIYLLVSSAFPEIKRLLPRSRTAPARVRLTYQDGHGVLRELLGRCSEHGFAVSDLTVEHKATARVMPSG